MSRPFARVASIIGCFAVAGKLVAEAVRGAGDEAELEEEEERGGEAAGGQPGDDTSHTSLAMEKSWSMRGGQQRRCLLCGRWGRGNG